MTTTNNEKDNDRKRPEKTYLDLLSLDIILPSTIICTSVFLSAYIYKSFFRRIPSSYKLPDSYFKKRSLLGRVTSVGDADNFRFYHTPAGIFGGWGWIRKVPKSKLVNQTIPIRLCGIDAPECAHFGKPAQKYSAEALQWLRGYVLGRRVRIVPLARDQYGRIVAQANVWKWNGLRNVSLEMLKSGWAVVYESKVGAEFNGKEALFRELEKRARVKKVGMFQHGEKIVTPGQYKRTHR